MTENAFLKFLNDFKRQCFSHRELPQCNVLLTLEAFLLQLIEHSGVFHNTQLLEGAWRDFYLAIEGKSPKLRLNVSLW